MASLRLLLTYYVRIISSERCLHDLHRRHVKPSQSMTCAYLAAGGIMLKFTEVKTIYVFCAALIHAVVMWSLRQYAYGTTAVLSWYVQYFAAQTILQRSYTETSFPSNLNYDGKIVWETGPRSMLPYGVTRPRVNLMYWFIYTLLSYTLL